MSTIRFIHYTDLHLRASNPPSRKGDYLADMLAKLDNIGELITARKVDFTTCGGDVFHNKAPESNPCRMVNTVSDTLKAWGVPNYCAEGNHDIRYDRADTLDAQPLGNLFRTGALIHSKKKVVSKKGLRVLVHSEDFKERPDFESIKVTDVDGHDISVLILHVYASPKGGDLFGTKVHSYEEISATGHDIYVLGHYHADNGVQTVNLHGKEQVFVNIGSLSRGDYGDENLSRSPKCCLVEINKSVEGAVSVRTEEIEVRCKPGHQVFDLEQKDRTEKQMKQAQEFVKTLKEATESTEGAETETVETALSTLTTDAEVLGIVRKYLSMAQEFLTSGKKAAEDEI